MELETYATTLRNTAKRIVALLLLLAWYILGIYLVVVTLAIEQFQERHRQLSASYTGGFASLRILENEEKAAIEAVAKSEAVLRELQPTIENIDASITEYKRKAMMYAGDAVRAKTDDEKTRLSVEAVRANAEQSLLEERRKKLHEPRDKAIEDLKRVQSKITVSERAALDVLRRLDAEEKQLTTYANPFFVMPREMLTLALTLSMGIFGSTIVVSRSILMSAAMKMRLLWFLVRPLQGAVIALAVFILAKAGIIIFSSQPSGSGAPVELNPFAIGFLGIVSGLYADHAYEYLERVAAKFFQAADKLPDNISRTERKGKAEETEGGSTIDIGQT